MGSSFAGLHAASLGGIWQCVVFGYLGVRLYGQKTPYSAPICPKRGRKSEQKIYWHGCHLEICADKKTVTVKKLGGDGDVSFLCGGKRLFGERRIDRRIPIRRFLQCNPKHLFFDLDGVLTSTDKYHFSCMEATRGQIGARLYRDRQRKTQRR